MDILGFRAPRLEPTQLVAFGPLLEKRDAASDEDSGRVRIGSVRELDKAARVDTWQPVPGGYVARLHVSSQGAAGLRVKLSLGPVPGAIEARVKGSEDRVDGMTMEPLETSNAWTPWTAGPDQVIELFSPVQPSAEAVSIESVVHFTDSPLVKAMPLARNPITGIAAMAMMRARTDSRETSRPAAMKG